MPIVIVIIVAHNNNNVNGHDTNRKGVIVTMVDVATGIAILLQ